MDEERSTPHLETPKNLCVCFYILGGREIYTNKVGKWC